MDITTLPLSVSREVELTRSIGGKALRACLIFLSGQVGLKAGQLVRVDPSEGRTTQVEEETKQAVINLAEVLQQHSLTLADIVDVTVFLVSPSDYLDFNRAYGLLFTKPFPSRTTVIASSLPLDARVELKAIAVKYKEA